MVEFGVCDLNNDMNSSQEAKTSYDLSRPKITLLGVGHVFDLRDAIASKILNSRPETVALELDAARFHALLTKKRGSRRGDMPLIYRMLAHFQQRLADQFGGEVGSEMIAAAHAAQETGARIALIDMDAINFFARLRKSMSLREKLSMLFGVLLSLFARKSTIERELKQYMSNEEQYLGELQKVYPSTVKVLIKERNKFMAKRLQEISLESKNIIAVVGDGHVSGMSRILSEFADVEILRLDDLRGSSISEKGDQLTISYHVNWGDSNS